MARLKDPSLPKSNFRLRQIERLMGYSWSAYRQTKEYSAKREYLTNLRARIDEWMAEPELVYDLAEGPSPTTKREPWSTISSADSEFPFDTPGETSEVFFYFAYRSSSELFSKAQLDLDEVKYCPLGKAAYWVTLFEKVFATAENTAKHFFSDETFDRHCKVASADKPHDRDRYFVLADPAGHRDGHTMLASSSTRFAQASKRANELAERFGIRFLVARVTGGFDAH